MFDLGDLGGVIRKAQERAQSMQKQLKEHEAEASSGGGFVTVRANGANELVSVRITQEAMDLGDLEMLEDLVLAAANQALKKAASSGQQQMASLSDIVQQAGFGPLFGGAPKGAPPTGPKPPQTDPTPPATE